MSRRLRAWHMVLAGAPSLGLTCETKIVHLDSRLAPDSGGSFVMGAPSFSLFGAFFPAWMFCALIGIVAAILARVAMVSSSLAKILPFQLFVCASIGLIVGLLVWQIWFGQ